MALELAKLLVATDGSENADYALNVALRIAEKYSSRIDLIYVRPPSGSVIPTPVANPVIGGIAVLVPPQNGTEDSKDAESIASKKAGDLLADRLHLILQRNIECSAIPVVSTDLAGEILRVSKTGGYNLVVLGSRGMSGLRSLILGSVSAKVAREAKCPVLVVKTRIDVIPRILLGYDGSEQSDKALDFSADFGKKFGAEVDPLGVVNVPIAPEGMIGADIDKWERDVRAQLDSSATKLRESGVRSNAKMVEHIDVARAISEEADEGSYDLIVVGDRGLGKLKSLFLGRVASGVMNSAKTNVLIVR